jgi:hypothetical protein
MIDQRDLQRRMGQTEVKETPALYLPWSQRVVNPFPLASSGGVWGDLAQPWAVQLLTFSASVFVATTNNATNFWTLSLINSAAAVLASISTASIAANTATRLTPTTSFVQPATSNASLSIIATATLNPGAIYIWPTLALLRTGN